jgi:hypothetical protein
MKKKNEADVRPASNSIVAPQVEIELDRTRHIRFNKAAMQKYCELTGRKITDGFSVETLDHACAFLLAGLSVEDPELTLEQVEEWMNPGVWIRTMRAFSEYLLLTAPARVRQETEASGKPSPLDRNSQAN